MCKDLLRYRRDTTGLALWFVLPLVIAALIGAVFGGEVVAPRGLLLIADEDRGVAGTFLRESVSRGPLGPMLALQQVDRAEGRRRLNKGDGSALLIIPKGYDRAVMRDEHAQWTLVANPELSLMPRVIQEVASANLGAAAYLQQIAGPQLRMLQDEPLSRRSLTTLAGLGGVTRGASTYLDPPRIRLKTTELGDPAAHRPTVTEILFPGIVLLVILMMGAGTSIEIWKETGAHTVRRVALSHAGLGGFLAGKLLATGAVLLIAIGITFGAARLAFSIPMRACPMALVWSGCCALVVSCALLLAQLVLATERSAATVGGIFLVPLAMIGGSFFPMESMPENILTIARHTPNGWMLIRLRSILAGPVPAALLARDFGILLAAGAILFALTRWRLEGRFAR
jgi:hypothetical protein